MPPAGRPLGAPARHAGHGATVVNGIAPVLLAGPQPMLGEFSAIGALRLDGIGR